MRRGHLAASISCLLILLLTCDSLVSAQPTGGDWTSFTLDDNNSRYQAVSTVTSANAGSLEGEWTFATLYSISATPVVSEGVVYFADWGGNVYAVSIADGSLVWETNLGAPISSTLLVYDGKVYVELGPTETAVYALSQTNGDVLWSTVLHGTMPASWTSPAVYNGLLYVGLASVGLVENVRSQVGEIDALNSSNGAFVWRFVTGGSAGGAGVWGTPVVDPSLNSIYFGTGNSFSRLGSSAYAYSIVSLNAMTGTLNWYYKLFNGLASGRDNDFGSSANLFSLSLGGSTYQALGLGSKNGDYYVLDRTDGRLIKSYAIGTPLGGIIGLAGFEYISADNPEVFIPSANTHRFNHDGEGVVEALVPATSTTAWKFHTPGNMIGSVALAPGVAIFGDSLGNLYALSLATGGKLWQTRVPFGVEGGVAIAEGHVLVGNFDNGGSAPSGLGLYSYAPSEG